MFVEIRVPAKINLWLEVVGKRSDGYHDLSSLMLPISIYDTIRIEIGADSGPISVACDVPSIPRNQENLAWRAADLFREASCVGAEMRIALEKRIPSGAGLGGGSADAAGVLLALNSCCKNVLDPAVMDGLAVKIGADVPFFLHQKPVLATGIGDKLQSVHGVPEYPLLLIKPDVNVSTASVYRNLKLTRDRAQIKLNCFCKDPWRLNDVIVNDLESVTIPMHPVLSDIKDWLLARGAVAALMSGSGPTVFGVFQSDKAALAAEAYAKTAWGECWVSSASVIGFGRS